MAEFADRMTSLTRNLRTSIQMRNQARKQIHDATVEMSNRNQAFMASVADENRTRAEELRESLAAHRDECRQRAEELRESHRESLDKMRGDLHEMLTETRKTRQDSVNQLFHTFQHARNELALDLREASFAWHGFVAGRDEPAAPMTKQRPHAHGDQGGAMTHAAAPKATTGEKAAHKARGAAMSGHARATGTKPGASSKSRSKPSRGNR